jgi:similar to spore coat protein
MGFLDTLFGIEDNDKMSDQDIVNDMLKDSKFTLNSLIMAISESRNPDFRQVLKKQMNTAVQNHFRLADISVENDWYHPYQSPESQVQEDYQNIQTLVKE